VKTARGLHDEISKELSEIGNGIDAFAGRVDCSTEHRAFLRHLSSKISSLSELLNAEIPGFDATSRTVFSIEIRSEISEINQMLEVEGAQEEILLQLRELLGFPRNFLEPGRTESRTLVPLTKREKEVLLLLPRGLTAKAMASELFLTEATIKTHLATIYRKFEVQNRTQAIAVGIESKLLSF